MNRISNFFHVDFLQGPIIRSRIISSLINVVLDIVFISSVIKMVGKVIFTIVFIPRFQYMAVIFCEPIIWCSMVAQLLFGYYCNPFIRGVEPEKTTGNKILRD